MNTGETMNILVDGNGYAIINHDKAKEQIEYLLQKNVPTESEYCDTTRKTDTPLEFKRFKLENK